MFYSVKIEGTTLTVPERYQNLAVVGRGAQGLVCTADDTLQNRKVAIKKLSRAFQNVTTAERAFREIRLMKLVDHKNVIGLLDAFTPQRSLAEFEEVYLVMEHMEAELGRVQTERLDHCHVSFLLYQLFCGLRHLHSAGIIHRDLKPSNILVASDCSLKIIDFGLARTAGWNRRLTQYVVTRHYRAPEVILGTDYGGGVDVWSAGCILAEILLHRVLFPGKDEINQWELIVATLGSPSRELCERLPDDVRFWLESGPTLSGRSFDVLFPDNPALSDEYNVDKGRQARDLLSRILVIDPENRITVDQALLHPYLSDWFQDTEVNAPFPGVCDLWAGGRAKAQTVSQWRELLYAEIMEYETLEKRAASPQRPVDGSGTTEAGTAD